MSNTDVYSAKRSKTMMAEDLEQLYPHNVQLYILPPLQDLSITEFEELAIDRLKVLRALEQTSSKNLRILSDEWKESVLAELNRDGLKGYVKLVQGVSAAKRDFELQARRCDYISHFLLRLAYCRSQELRRWFVTREMELFKLKFSSLSTEEITQFLVSNNLKYTPLTEEEKAEVKDGLYESTSGQSVTKIEMLDFFRVHFTEVFDLVRTKRCYLKNGYAYVNAHDFVSIVAAKQQKIIEDGLEAATRLLPEIECDDRLFNVLKGLHTSYTGKDFTVAKSGEVPIESLDQLSKKSFPLCMRTCHETLRAKHHLKHGGRLQFMLFLKGIGVTLEGAMQFFREEFCKIIPLEKFEKEYAYNVRHTYGKEGSMINYTPYSCMKIITENVGPQDNHGCPYKTLDASVLRQRLLSYGLSHAHVQDIVGLAQKGHYQIACTKQFEYAHSKPSEQGGISHPNLYFTSSQILMGNRTAVAKGAGGGSQRRIATKNGGHADAMNDNDDDELWNLAETEESKISCTQMKTNLEEWDDDDFDITQVEMDF